MKKVIYFAIILLLAFLIATYISLNNSEKEKALSILINIDNVDSFNFKKHDSVLVAASFLYNSNDFKNIMQGEHYRKAWAAPIKVPIVFLDTLFGGSKIIDIGGGKQTKSLKLETENGTIYTLRSINKNPNPLIPSAVKSLGLENIIIDGISAQHPYAAIPVAHLAQSVGLLHTHPKIVFLPKQSSLGKYNDVFGNKIFLLEYETKGKVNWTKYSNVLKILDTDGLIELKNKEKTRLTIDKELLIKNRLFDLIIGDWDRHAKQWGWVIIDEDSKLKAIPLAGDRDNAYFNMEGIIPSIISNPNMVKELRSFEKDINNMSGLVQPFDRYFLINTNEDLFIKQAYLLKTQLSDKLIDEALNTWPKNILELDGKEIKNKMINRRNNIVAYAKNFKKTIDKEGYLKEWPLKGCEDLELQESLKICFECLEQQ
ncbi:hypothetical protein SAMN05428642_102380 [Flaviramulus basaltis]|uniref:Uncharacterized protein n=1 Tax=Flaviramulus basaltis TaxID=369401 RepID=A0A1K2IHD7_9FLAO|nr:hypothetical protein [Flaviramulus basaltis]SFZ91841.1 hypothetical protein SAMN05428642_102380 [Flaviramulus basaltis]